MPVYEKIAQRFPGLELKLKKAGLDQTPVQYVKRTVFLSFIIGFCLCIIVFFYFQKLWLFLLFPIGFGMSFMYFMRYVDLKIQKLRKKINQEIVYAGRFLIIELESGVPMYHAFKNLAKNYDTVGKYFEEVVRDVNFGTSLEDALDKAISRTPSPQLRKILWQVLNSLKTGADVKASLNAVLEQIVRQQQIDVKEYGRKLNPLAMFYMMIAIIVPSLGTTMMVVMATFVGFSLPLTILLIIVGVVGFIQLMFFAFVKSSRPPMAL